MADKFFRRPENEFDYCVGVLFEYHECLTAHIDLRLQARKEVVRAIEISLSFPRELDVFLQDLEYNSQNDALAARGREDNNVNRAPTDLHGVGFCPDARVNHS